MSHAVSNSFSQQFIQSAIHSFLAEAAAAALLGPVAILFALLSSCETRVRENAEGLQKNVMLVPKTMHPYSKRKREFMHSQKSMSTNEITVKRLYCSGCAGSSSAGGGDPYCNHSHRLCANDTSSSITMTHGKWKCSWTFNMLRSDP